MTSCGCVVCHERASQFWTFNGSLFTSHIIASSFFDRGNILNLESLLRMVMVHRVQDQDFVDKFLAVFLVDPSRRVSRIVNREWAAKQILGLNHLTKLFPRIDKALRFGTSRRFHSSFPYSFIYQLDAKQRIVC